MEILNQNGDVFHECSDKTARISAKIWRTISIFVKIRNFIPKFRVESQIFAQKHPIFLFSNPKKYIFTVKWAIN